jgi:hypothetical protein
MQHSLFLEPIMSHFATEFASPTTPVRTYLVNLGRATRTLLAALFAVKTAPSMAVTGAASDDSNFAAAGENEQMPNLSAELRFMASRA